MAKIILHRPKEYNNKLRDYTIYINNKKTGTISNDETVEFNLAEGHHTIRAKIDWCGSKELIVHLNESETKKLEVNGFKLGRYLLPVTGSILLIHFIFKYSADINFLIVLAIPGILILFYYLSIGRNEYLYLKENNN